MSLHTFRIMWCITSSVIVCFPLLFYIVKDKSIRNRSGCSFVFSFINTVVGKTCVHFVSHLFFFKTILYCKVSN